jgi:hypothetical protein
MEAHFPFTLNMPAVVALMIPIIAIIGAFAVGIVAMVLKSRAREQAQRERIFLAEKGLEIPRELYEAKEKTVSDFGGVRAWLIVLGVICVFVGISVLIALTIQSGIRDGSNGLIVALIGVGFLVSERLILSLIVRPRLAR